MGLLTTLLFTASLHSVARLKFTTKLAPQRGIEPRTKRLTVFYSTAELLGNYVLHKTWPLRCTPMYIFPTIGKTTGRSAKLKDKTWWSM